MYDPKLVPRLTAPGTIVRADGFTAEIKDVPDAEKDNCIDPRYYEFQMDSFKKKMTQPDPDPNEPLEKIRERMGVFTPNMNHIQIRTMYKEINTAYGIVPVWIYFPRYREPDSPALIYLHGGGFYLGSAFDVENDCRLMAEWSGGAVFNVDYSLAPELKYPGQPTQAYDVLSYIHENPQEFGIDPDWIYIAGDSAGGNLALSCAIMDRDKGTHYLRGQALIYPVISFTHEGMDGYERSADKFVLDEEQRFLLGDMAFLGSDPANAMISGFYCEKDQDLKDPVLSPAFADVSGLPETFMFLSEYDGLRLEGEYFAKKLEASGVKYALIEYRGMGHGFFDRLGQFPQAEAVAYEIASFVKRGKLSKSVID